MKKYIDISVPINSSLPIWPGSQKPELRENLWKIANALKTTAIDMTATAGFDFDSGYGLIQADAAVEAAIAVVVDPSAL